MKKPDRGDDVDSEKPKEKAKKPERPNKEDRSAGGADHKRRQNIENKEDRGRKSVASIMYFKKKSQFEQKTYT